MSEVERPPLVGSELLVDVEADEPVRAVRLAPVARRDPKVPADQAVDEDGDQDDRRRDEEEPGPPSPDCPSSRVSSSLPALSLLRVLVRRVDERRLELRHVLVLEEQTKRRVDVGVPGVARNDTVRERARQLVGLPLRERPLEVGVVQLRVRVLACRDRALDRVERVLRPPAAEEAEPLNGGRAVRCALRQREAVGQPVVDAAGARRRSPAEAGLRLLLQARSGSSRRPSRP